MPTTQPKLVHHLLWERMLRLKLSTVGISLFVVLMLAQAAHGFTDPDYWWHFKTGEYVVNAHQIPHADIFTWTAAGRAWTAHEWLSEAFMYSLVRLGGYGLAVIVFALSPVATVLLLFRLLQEERIADRAALPILALASLMIAIYSTVRPQVLSWVLFALLFYVLYGYRAGRIRRLWGLPFLFMLWANLHLSFTLGLGIFGLFIAAEGLNQWLGTRTLRIGHLVGIFLASLAAACVNPEGVGLLLYPIRYAALQGTALSAIAEWKSPDFHSYLFAPLAVALVILTVTGLSYRQFDAWPIGLGAAVVALGLQSTRYVPIFAVAFVPLAALAMAERWTWARAGDRPPTDPQRAAANWLLMLAVIAILVVALRPSAGSELAREPRTVGQLVPVAAVDFIQSHGQQARIFNQYEWGGYIIYRLWPQQRPFVDGRGEMFDPDFLDSYFKTASALPGWQSWLDKYNVNLIVVRSDSPLAGALETNPRWRREHADDLAVVYTRE